MTRMGSASQLGDVRRLSKSIRSSKKSLLYSDYYDDDSKDTSVNFPAQRSVSLTTLSPSSVTIEPRMAQLETLEAKMASIEVSLSTTATPRRKKSGTSTPVPGAPPTSGSTPTPPSRAATPASVTKDAFTRDMEGLRATLRDKENNVLHTLKNQLAVKRLTFVGKPGTALNEVEKKAAHDRLNKLKADLDNKRMAIKNIKLALDTIDVTDNIDTRIQQAELEYQLGREELSLLSILEESRNLQASLEDTIAQQPTIFSYIGNSAISLYGVEVMYDAKSPIFGACQKEDGGLYIDWAAEGSCLTKGDRLLEVNGKLVLSKTKDDLRRLLSVSPSPAQVVFMRRHQAQTADNVMSQLRCELNVVREQADEAERVRDSFRNDNVRLSHRISYLEEQVAELLDRARENASMSDVSMTDRKNKDILLFQKGSQVALVSETKSSSKHKNGNSTKDEVARLAKSMDLLVEKPKRKKDLARSTNSLDQEIRHRHHNGNGNQSDSMGGRYHRDVRSSLGYLESCDSDHGNNRKHLDYSSETNSRHHHHRPVPPKKPIRLSLQKASSVHSVDSNGTLEKRTLKRTHKGEAPPVPKNHQILVQATSTDSWC